jgi:hypothetical protein
LVVVVVNMRGRGKESSYMIIHFAKIEKIRTHAPPSPIPPPTVPTTLLRAAGLFTEGKNEDMVIYLQLVCCCC